MQNIRLFTSFVTLITLCANISTIAQLDSIEPIDSLKKKPFPGFVNIALNQTTALEIREAEIGYGFNFNEKSSLDLSAGIVSGFSIDVNKNTRQSTASNYPKFNHETVHGFGKQIAVNFFHDHGQPYRSALFHSVSLRFQKLQSVRDPQDLVFDHYQLSVDEFNANISSLALGIGYKFQFSESAVRFAVAWVFLQTNYEANGSQFTSQKSSIINRTQDVYYHDEFLTNTVTLKVS